MNVESTTSKITTSKTESSTQPASSNSAKDSTTSFKDELAAVKTQDSKSSEQENNVNESNTTNPNNTQNIDEEQKAAGQNNTEEILKGQINNEKNKANDDLENKFFAKSFNELTSQISEIKEMKQGSNLDSKTKGVTSKFEDKAVDKTTYCKTMNMDNNDISFFLNLVDNQQMIAQNLQGQTPNTVNSNNFTDIKSEATQQTVQVSATLMDALNESVKTNKPFRIDFDSDVAVIMKVDQNGVLSANFIPGNAAVENYLRNNLESLKQSFNEQNLQYNELSYSNRQKQENRENQSKKNKENKDE